MCSGRRRSNGRRIEMEKSPAAPKRCRIILCPEFAGAFLLSDRVLRDCTPRALPRASRAGRHVASLRTMTRQAVQRCTSALLPLNYPVHGAQGAPLQTQSVCTFLSVARLSRQRCAGPGCPRPYNTLRYYGAIISHTRRGTAACGRFLGGGTARPACRTPPPRRAPERSPDRTHRVQTAARASQRSSSCAARRGCG